MTATPRYAIYLAPDGDLRDAAEAWLGRAASPRTTAPAPVVPEGWTREQVDAITINAARYGFHATIKAPFRLAPGRSAAELADRISAFATAREPMVVPTLTLRGLGPFFALVAGGESTAVHSLAGDVVRDFDDFRAPPTQVDLARRRPELLDARERELLHRFGYPYVLDRFLLHFTLTDAIPIQRQPEVESALHKHFATLLGRDLVVDSLALFVEPGPGEPFVLASSHPFGKGVQ